MSKVIEVFTWALANKAALLGAAVALIGAASLLIKALEALVSIFVTVFPSLKGVDGELKSVAAWLDALSKSGFLNTLAASPKAVKSLLLVCALAMGLSAAPARAQVQVSTGPTIPLLQVRPGDLHPVSVAPGAGYQVSLTLPSLTRAIGGKSWDLLDLQGLAFGSSISSASGQQFGALSAALGLCTLSSLLCVGVGHDLISSAGAPTGWFGLFALSFNFALAPTSPPVGISEGAAGLPKANTLFLGAP